jgi:hypothetical protein
MLLRLLYLVLLLLVGLVASALAQVSAKEGSDADVGKQRNESSQLSNYGESGAGAPLAEGSAGQRQDPSTEQNPYSEPRNSDPSSALSIVLVVTALATLTIIGVFGCMLVGYTKRQGRGIESIRNDLGENKGKLNEVLEHIAKSPAQRGNGSLERNISDLAQTSNRVHDKLDKLQKDLSDQMKKERPRQDPANVEALRKQAQELAIRQDEIAGLRQELQYQRRALETEQEKLADDRRDFEVQRQAYQRELERQQAQFQESHDKNKKAINDLAEREAALAAEMDENSKRKQANDKASNELHRRELALQQRETELNDSTDRAEQEKQRIGQDRSGLQTLRESLWPEPFVSGSLTSWREKIEAQWPDHGSLARLVWLALGRYQTVRLRQEHSEIPRALRELGRAAYQFWAELGLSDAEQATAARCWADALMTQLDGRYVIRIPEVGEIKDTTWMTYPGGSGSSVAKVQAWCVQNDKRIAVEKALVA